MRADPPSDPLTARWRAATRWLVVLCLCAGALRLVGADFGLPHRPMGDERVWSWQLALLRGPREAALERVVFGFYPQLVPRVARLVAPRAADATTEARPLEARDGGASTAEVAAQRDLSQRDHLLLRRIGAALSLLAPLSAWLLARRWCGTFASAVAAGLVATSLLAHWYAPQARPHGAASGLLPFGVWACLRVRERGGAGAYALAALSIAAAVGVLQSGFLLLVPLALAHALRRREAGGGRLDHAALLLVLVAVAASVRLSYPFAFERPADPPESLDGHAVFGQAFLGLEHVDGSGLGVLLGTFAGVDPLFFGSWIGALALWFASRPPVTAGARRFAAGIGGLRERLAPHGDLLVVAGFVLPYFTAFALYDLTFSRYLLPLQPFAALCVALAIERGLDRRPRPARVLAGLGLVVVTLQSAAVLKLAWLRREPDTFESSAAWLDAHVDRDRDRVLLLLAGDVPLARRAAVTAAPRDFASPWALRQEALGAEWSRAHGVELVRAAREPGVTRLAFPPRDAAGAGTDWLWLDAAEARRRPGLRELAAGLAARESARFWPHDDGLPVWFRDQGDEFEQHGPWAWRILCARALGPPLTILRRE